MKLHRTVAILLLLLGGCQNVWVKPGTSNDDFNADRYTCLQQSQQHAGRAVVNQYGGTAATGVVTNEYLFNSCMNAKGWSLQNADAYKQTTSQQASEYQRKKTEYQVAMKSLDEEAKAVCAKPEYAELFVKTQCQAIEITFEQLADSSKITLAQKKVLPKYRTEMDAISKKRNEHARNNGLDGDKRWADYLDSVTPEIDKFTLDLYNGVITWGEYNKQRKELTARLQSEWRSRMQKNN